MRMELREAGKGVRRASPEAAVAPTGGRAEETSIAVRALHLVVLSAFAIAQPLFSVFRASPDFFVSRRSQPIDLVALAVVLVLGVPAVALAISHAFGRVRRGWDVYAHDAFVALLFGLLFLTFLSKSRSLETADTVVLAILGSAICTLLYAKRQWASQLLSIGAPAPLFFVFVFLFTPPVSQLTVGRRAAPQAVASEPVTTPVVFVVFDEFPLPALMTPSGSLDARRFPNISALAQTSTWFRNAGSVDSLTKWAVPAILSGRLGDRADIPSDASYPDNLFTLLGGSGYKMHVHEPITSLCPKSVCTDRQPLPPGQRMSALLRTTRQVYSRMLFPGLYPEGPASVTDPFSEFLGDVGSNSTTVRDEHEGEVPNPDPTPSFESVADTLMHSDRAGRFRGFVSEIDGADKQLHFIHILLPHTPYEYAGSDRRYELAPTSDEFKQAIAMDGGQWVSEAAYQRELLQTRYVDQLIGELTARMKQVGVFDRSLVVVTADHGVNWQPFQAPREAGETSRYETGLVPLLVKAPFQRAGEVDDTLVQTTDILPTIAGILHMRLPWQTDGQDVRNAAFPPRTVLSIRDHVHDDPVLLDNPAAGAMQAAARMAHMFGDGSSAYDGFDVVGPYSGMIGRPLSELPRPVETGLVATLTEPSIAVNGPTPLPSLQLAGMVRGPIETGSWMAVVVNGRVAAVVPAITPPPPAPPAPTLDPLAPAPEPPPPASSGVDPAAGGSSIPDPFAPDAQLPDPAAPAPGPAPADQMPPPPEAVPRVAPSPSAPPAALPRLQTPLASQAAFLALLVDSLVPRSGPVTLQLFTLSGVGPGLRVTTVTLQPAG